jgi:hypothetical protein
MGNAPDQLGNNYSRWKFGFTIKCRVYDKLRMDDIAEISVMHDPNERLTMLEVAAWAEQLIRTISYLCFSIYNCENS